MRPIIAIKALLFTILVPGSVILYFPYTFITKAGAHLQLSNPILFIPALLSILIGSATYIRCAWDFAVDGMGTPAPIDPPKKLVVTGFYRYTRNPMYQGVVMLLVAEILLFPSSGLITYVLSIAAVFHLFVVLHEERVLARRFGDAYLNYCRKVPRWGFAWQPFNH
ncbi:MAG: methyltransferase family protein [Gammaproteobacteria bacterium]